VRRGVYLQLWLPAEGLPFHSDLSAPAASPAPWLELRAGRICRLCIMSPLHCTPRIPPSNTAPKAILKPYPSPTPKHSKPKTHQNPPKPCYPKRGSAKTLQVLRKRSAAFLVGFFLLFGVAFRLNLFQSGLTGIFHCSLLACSASFEHPQWNTVNYRTHGKVDEKHFNVH
jgi:hypothetical protein